jgi:hypothetical protein
VARTEPGAIGRARRHPLRAPACTLPPLCRLSDASTRPIGVGLFSPSSASGLRPRDLSGNTAWPSDELTATVRAHSAELVGARTAERALVAADPSFAVGLQGRPTPLTLHSHLEHEPMLAHPACQRQCDAPLTVGGLGVPARTRGRGRWSSYRPPLGGAAARPPGGRVLVLPAFSAGGSRAGAASAAARTIPPLVMDPW